ncbi:MAG: tRNA (adenosine(37)-N6)-dimethylallyltransferase MiaA [Sphingomonadales bacterium]|nr:tRNA (adenosine(37)-N6)-dimethylallyltransferase MiaA [Sphingomonadales bacterium]
MSAKVIFIAGATASGKSGLALAVAKAIGGTIINADSMQVYNTLQILSARPSDAEMQGVPHKLYGFLNPDANYSVAHWHDDAMAEIAKAEKAGSVPILVGGTGLYFKSLLDGLNQIPEIDGAIRGDVRTMLEGRGAEHIYKLLLAEDPDMAAQLNKADGQRLARALEVFRSTGVSLLEWQKKPQSGGLQALDANGQILKLVVERPRDETYDRINKRLVEMVAEGALDEVRQLQTMHIAPDSLAMKALGVPSFMEHLKGDKNLDECITEAQTLTRRYAKRQMTWLRNQFPNWRRVSPDDMKKLPTDELLKALEL